MFQRVKHKGTCTIVVSDGAIHSIRDQNVQDRGYDESGNAKFMDVGRFIKQEIEKYYQQKGQQVDIKYIDPQYMVRAVQSNSHDTKKCT